MTFADIVKRDSSTPEKTLKAVLAGMGWTHATLAKVTGYTPQTIRNVACGARQSRRAWRKIEAALGVPIWSQLESDETKPRAARDHTL